MPICARIANCRCAMANSALATATTSGGLHGLMRVRGFVQDDGHIFCTEAQIESEVTAFNALVFEGIQGFGFHDVSVKLALRPDSKVGSEEIWDKSEDALRAGLRASGITWEELPGEGRSTARRSNFISRTPSAVPGNVARYRVDFSMPGRLGAEFVDEDNTRKVPVMLHRAILGSLERFIGILVENHAGALPLWLAPVQMAVINISQRRMFMRPKLPHLCALLGSVCNWICAMRRLPIKYVNIACRNYLTS